ncbi:variant SH3 domain-containing protein [Ditylenchus destructor]|nr:variant SH3 domain-containing protein [Ditylenchus destructor]
MMAKYNYDPRFQSPNPHGEQEELSFCSGDTITVYGEMDVDGFYFGELNGKRGFISNALISPQAKAWIFSVYQYEFYPYMAAQNHIVPIKILFDISNFIPDDDVQNLTFVSRALAVVMMKKLPIIEANELSFCRGDEITIYGEMDKEGFYFGTLNGVRGLVPSNFLPSNLQDLQPWEIIRILYREDPELTMERRDRISANFHFDKILVEEYWSLLIHRNKKGKIDLWDATSPKQTFLSTTKTDNYRAVTRYRPPIQTNPAGDIPFHQRMRTERDGNLHRKHPKKIERKPRWKY